MISTEANWKPTANVTHWQSKDADTENFGTWKSQILTWSFEISSTSYIDGRVIAGIYLTSSIMWLTRGKAVGKGSVKKTRSAIWLAHVQWTLQIFLSSPNLYWRWACKPPKSVLSSFSLVFLWCLSCRNMNDGVTKYFNLRYCCIVCRTVEGGNGLTGPLSKGQLGQEESPLDWWCKTTNLKTRS